MALASKNQFQALDDELDLSLSTKKEKISIMMPPKRCPLKSFPTPKSRESFPSLSSVSISSNPVSPVTPGASPGKISYAEKLRKMAEEKKEIERRLEEQKRMEELEKKKNSIHVLSPSMSKYNSSYASSSQYDRYSDEDDEYNEENLENDMYGREKRYEEYSDDYDTCKPYDGTEYSDEDENEN